MIVLLYFKERVSVIVDNIPFYINPTFRKVFKSIMASYDKNLDLHDILKLQITNLITNKEDVSKLTAEGIIELQNKLWLCIADLTPKEQLMIQAAKDFEVDSIFDYVYDYKYIYPSFMAEYNIDLERNDKLTWFEFKSLFMGLSDKSRIKQVIHIRTMKMPSLTKDAE